MEPVKFTFDEDFSADGSGNSYNNKMQKLSDEAFEQGKEVGKEQGYTESIQSIERNCELILENISNTLVSIAGRHQEQTILIEKSATELVLAIIQKLAPAIVKEKPLVEIEHLVKECMINNPLEPRMIIRIDEQILPHLRKKIDIIQTSSDYRGQIVLVSEQMNNISDCRVEWVDGGAERDFEGVLNSIEETVKVFIEAPLPHDI